MPIDLYKHQIDAINRLRTGNVLCGGVGSGKSRTALVYFYTKVCDGRLEVNGEGFDDPPRAPRDLYIITTPAKRDSMEWEEEALPLLLSKQRDCSICGIQMTVDSWNNIAKYTGVEHAFFVFDEQRVVGKGKWVKSFLKIAKKNDWILLSATPGDRWVDYVPLFVANGFYKNRTEFNLRHVIYNSYTKYPKIEGYLEEELLSRLKNNITVQMPYTDRAPRKVQVMTCGYDVPMYCRVVRDRWNIFKGMPIKQAGELCFAARKVVNMDDSRLERLRTVLILHKKVIVFYNFDYELHALRDINKILNVDVEIAERNGHKHDPVPDSDRWVYLVQYTSGAEAWNCIKTNVIVFYSLNYSYRTMVQAAGRIDRLNTPFDELEYYLLKSDSTIDNAIVNALRQKKNFNEELFE